MASFKKFRNNREFVAFVKTENVKQKVKEGTLEFTDLLPDHDFVYGVPNPVSTPIQLVVSFVISEFLWQRGREKVNSEIRQTQPGQGFGYFPQV